jgi:hypothetical protein
MGPGRTGGYHYPVQFLLSKDLPQIVLGILGTGKKVFF